MPCTSLSVKYNNTSLSCPLFPWRVDSEIRNLQRRGPSSRCFIWKLLCWRAVHHDMKRLITNVQHPLNAACSFVCFSSDEADALLTGGFLPPKVLLVDALQCMSLECVPRGTLSGTLFHTTPWKGSKKTLYYLWRYCFGKLKSEVYFLYWAGYRPFLLLQLHEKLLCSLYLKAGFRVCVTWNVVKAPSLSVCPILNIKYYFSESFHYILGTAE